MSDFSELLATATVGGYITATRYHDFSAGHRVVGHENKCAHLHGHNYRVHFHVGGPLDAVGRVIDFGVIKTTLCDWLEKHWDHRMLLWSDDPDGVHIYRCDPLGVASVPFNPTAENMAKYLCLEIGPRLLPSPLRLYKVHVEETRKCGATFEIPR